MRIMILEGFMIIGMIHDCYSVRMDSSDDVHNLRIVTDKNDFEKYK